MSAAKAASAAATPTPLSSAVAAAVVPLHLAPIPENLMAARRTRTITHHERIISGPNLPAHLVISAVTEAEQDDKMHPAEVWIRMESAPETGPQLVVGYTQETTS